jgi:phospholipase C
LQQATPEADPADWRRSLLSDAATAEWDISVQPCIQRRNAADSGPGSTRPRYDQTDGEKPVMPLSANDLSRLGDVPITIQSTHYPNVYLRMDGTGVVSTTDNGGGKVNCQYNTGPFTAFVVRPQPDGSFAFESIAFPGVFMRMDGRNVPSTGAGGGTVNCQFGVDAWEKYLLLSQPDSSFSFGSAAFPGVYLRLVTGSGVTSATGPGGTVNCVINGNGGPDEKFLLDLA